MSGRGLPLPAEQANQLAARTIFAPKEIHSLYKRFKDLDVSGNNILEYEVGTELASLAVDRPNGRTALAKQDSEHTRTPASRPLPRSHLASRIG